MKSQREWIIQCAFIRWLKLQHNGVLYCASAGGLHTSYTQGAKMKAAGYVKGHPDLLIYEPAGGYVGLAMELKSEDGEASKEQKTWLRKLEARGWKTCITKGLDDCIREFETYIKAGAHERKANWGDRCELSAGSAEKSR